MLVAGPGAEPVAAGLLRLGADPADASAAGAELDAVEVSFGDASQIFHGGPASCAVYGVPAGPLRGGAPVGLGAASRSCSSRPRRLAREGVALNGGQAYVAEILASLLTSTPECAALWAPDGAGPARGRGDREPGARRRPRRLAADGPQPFYTGDIARAVSDWLDARGGSLTRGRPRRLPTRSSGRPCGCAYRDREILTNPPPSAGGLLLAYSLGLLDARAGAADPGRRRERDAVPRRASAPPSSSRGSAQDGFLERFLGTPPGLDDAHLGDRRRRARPAA